MRQPLVRGHHHAVLSQEVILRSVPLLHSIYLESFQLQLLFNDFKPLSARQPVRGPNSGAFLWLLGDGDRE